MDIEIYKKGYKDYLCTLHFARDIILGQCNVREQFTGRPEGPSVPAGPGGPMGPGISFGFTSYPAATSLQPQGFGILQIVNFFSKTNLTFLSLWDGNTSSGAHLWCKSVPFLNNFILKLSI